MNKRSYFITFACLLCLLYSCKKDRGVKPPVPPVTTVTGNKGIYADSLLFIQAAAAIVKPSVTTQGTFSSVPEGLKIDLNTGEIDVNKSETGLKYRVTFTPQTGDPQISTVIISGINYEDKIYNLSKGDSIAVPIYNADAKQGLPGSGSGNIFDESGGCKKAGIVVGSTDAKINLALSVRNQGSDTGATQEVKLAYRINDGSNKALNGLDVKIYFYRTANEIPQYLTDLIAERKRTILNSSTGITIQKANTFTLASLAVNAKLSRPRPPCIIVVSR
jgi:hypothetical protein